MKILNFLAFGFSAILMLSGCFEHKKMSDTNATIEQTICFSNKGSGVVSYAVLGDDVVLSGGMCDGSKLSDMNAKGWKLTQVITGLQSSFGMVFEKK